jgi:hypothetical protein
MNNSTIRYVLLLFYVSIGWSTNCNAQSTLHGMPFQAMARDRYNNPVKNQLIYIQSNLLFSRDSQLVFSEEFESQSDDWGIFQISVGNGRYRGGIEREFLKVPFNKLNLLLQLKISIPPVPPIVGWNYQDNWIDLVTAPFGMVPYAMYALQGSGSIALKSKGRSSLLQAVDSFAISLNDLLDMDDGISVVLEADKIPISTPSYYIQRDAIRNRILIYFTAPFSGFLSWMIID